MITLQSSMLIALGFLLASLVFIALSTAYRKRVERLTTEKIRRSIPITEAEIRADKDRLRAQFAIRVHKLEAQSEQQQLSVARQRIEMNRRDARIAELVTELEALRANLEENVNARRVLEHTVTDRLPRLEQQLDGARGLIEARDQEMVALKSETTRSVRALDEAMQINAQQRSELERVKAVLSRHGGDAGLAGGSRFEGEIALRSEIEALRAKTREQSQLIARLQTVVTSPSVDASGNKATGDTAGELDRLRRELAAAQAQLSAANDEGEKDYDESLAAGWQQATDLQTKIDAQATEIARLSAALAAYEEADQNQAVGRDSRIASKARINSLQAQLDAQNDTMMKLRSELAASNEKLARQAAYFMDQMRRLGSGTVQTSVNAGRARDETHARGLAHRLSQARSGAEQASEAVNGSGGRGRQRASGRRGAGGTGRGSTSSKVAEYIKALSDPGRAEAELPEEESPGGDVSARAPTAQAATATPTSDSAGVVDLTERQGGKAASLPQQTGAAISALARVAGGAPAVEDEAGSSAAAANSGASKRKSKLLDRISGLGKS